MFEAVVSVCLALAGQGCVTQILPGFEAKTQAACQARLAHRDPVAIEGASGPPLCMRQGPALSVVEVAAGVFVHKGLIEEPTLANRGDVSNLGFVVGAASVAVIDTGAARWIGEGLWRAIRSQTDLPVSHVVLTHMHPDHVFGASIFVEAGALVVGHTGLDRALADRRENYRESLARLIGPSFGSTTSVPVDVAVEDSLDIDLGQRRLVIQAWPTAHTTNDLTVYDTETSTLFTGDLVFHEHTPALDGHLMGWRQVVDDLANLDVRRVVPGHGGPALDWPDGAEDLARYLQKLEDDTRAALDRGDRLGQAVGVIAQDEAEAWALFEAYNPRNATVAFTELEWE